MGAIAEKLQNIQDAQTALRDVLFAKYPMGSDVRWKVQRWIHVGIVERQVDRQGDPRLYVRNRQTGKTRYLTAAQIVE